MSTAMDPVGATPILTEQVYEKLKGAITDGVLQPGQRVRQAELADHLGVSRAPVSHALHLLKHQGLVRESGRRGVEIAPIDPDLLRDVYQIRASLDSLAARLLAARFSEGRVERADEQRLVSACTVGERLTLNAPLRDRVEADVAFHREIYRLCGNPAIEETLAPLWPHIQRAMNAVISLDEIRTRAWSEHARIVTLIREGQADAAAEAAWSHAANAGSDTERRLRSLSRDD